MASLENVDFGELLSGPLKAAIEASVQAQRHKATLIQRFGMDDQGRLKTADFFYHTEVTDPDTGDVKRVRKKLSIPVLLFLEFPNLYVHEIKQTFSVEVKEIKEQESETESSPLTYLTVSPSSKSSTRKSRIERTFDLEGEMTAELDNESEGLHLLRKKAETQIFDQVVGDFTEDTRERPDGGERETDRERLEDI